MTRICIIPNMLNGFGGPASFQQKLVKEITNRGLEVTPDLGDPPYDAILVINSTRELAGLWAAKRKGVPVIQRLGGINWQHRCNGDGVQGYILGEVRNLMMRFVRSFLANHVVYQSQFVEDWWNRKYGKVKASSSVIYNAVDLDLFNPHGSRYLSQADVCIISVEGTQGTDLSEITILLARGLIENGVGVELLVFGSPWKDARSRFARHPFVKFKGLVPNSELPYFYRGATFYVPTDLIAACPNSVIEALACGTPVLGYQAGVLHELVTASAGRMVGCSGDPWKAESPGNLSGLVSAAHEIITRRDQFSLGARHLANKRYGLDKMVDAYLEILA